MKLIPVIPILMLVVSACTTTLEESYDAWEGKAKITSIKTSDYNPTGKNEYLDIYFDFTPANPEAPGKYRFKKEPDVNRRFFHDHRGNLHKKWVADTGIKVNNVYPATRYEKKAMSGGAPVFFRVRVAQ